MKNIFSINIGWLYPTLMSTYGDRGNILVLKSRLERRSIDVAIIRLDKNCSPEDYSKIDLFFAGGAQDLQQSIVMMDLIGKKADSLSKKIESETPALFVCGAPQLMGLRYIPATGNPIKGVGLFDMETKASKDKARLIGNIKANLNWENLNNSDSYLTNTKYKTLVGFENHGGRTYLGRNILPLAQVINGFGNNGEDSTEGMIYKNAIGTYLHGPLLSKNPHIADWLIERAIYKKYKTQTKLTDLDDKLEWSAHQFIYQKT